MKKYLTRPICLLLSAVILAGALTAAALVGSPYDTLKTALLDTAFASSGTVETTLDMYVDGELLNEESSFSRMQYSPEGRLNVYDNGAHFESRAYSVYDTKFNEEDNWYTIYKNYYNDDEQDYSLLSGYVRDDAYIRFAELAVDFLVGDLKNNISISERDGLKTLSGTLTAGQIPELYNAGLSLMITAGNSYGSYGDTETISETDTKYVYRETYLEGKSKTVRVVEVEYTDKMTEKSFTERYGYFDQAELDNINSNYYKEEKNRTVLSEKQEEATAADYGDPLEQPMESAYFDYVDGVAHVDKDGYITDLKATVRVIVKTIFGETHEMEAVFEMKFENMGTTVIECPIPGIDEIFTDQLWTEKKGANAGGSLYFKLNADGTIDQSSITADYGRDPEVIFEKELPADYVEVPKELPAAEKVVE